MLNKVAYLETTEKSYPMMLTLNVIEDIQETFGSLENWENEVMPKDGEPNIKSFKKTIAFMINEGIDFENEEKNKKEPFVTEKKVGRIITAVGFGKTNEIFAQLVRDSNVTTEKNVETPENQ